MIVAADDTKSCVTWKAITDRFNKWFKDNYSTKPPAQKVLKEYMDKRFKSLKHKTHNKWYGLRLVSDGDEIDGDNEEEENETSLVAKLK